MIEGEPVALVVGPENGAINERLVYEGAREAHARSYAAGCRLSVSRSRLERVISSRRASDLVDIPAFYVQATPDLVMGDLLKTMRSSQIFSVTGLPDVAITEGSPRAEGRSSALPSGATWPRRLRPDNDAGRPPRRVGRARVVPRHRLQRDVLPRLASVLPANERLGESQAAHWTASTRTACGNTWRARQARRSWQATDARLLSKLLTIGETSCWSSRISTKRDDRRRCDFVRSRRADPLVAVRGAEGALADRGGQAPRATARSSSSRLLLPGPEKAAKRRWHIDEASGSSWT